MNSSRIKIFSNRSNFKFSKQQPDISFLDFFEIKKIISGGHNTTKKYFGIRRIKMPHCALIMDQAHARIIEFTKDASEFHKVEKKTHHFHHHSSHEGTEDRKKFFHLLASELKSYKQILILGAGIGKDQFKKYLDEHNHEISKNILSVITIDHPTDHQILAKAKEFFKDHHIPL